jgi:hypothetical protein
MIFSWSESSGAILPVYSDNTKYIKYLDAGQSTILSYKVIADVNADPGLYQLDLSLKYQSLSNSTTSVISTKAGIFIGGQTDFDVAFSESSAGQTSLSVANTGNNPASSVTVKIPEQPDYIVSGSNSAIIGNLDKGDYTLVSFQIISRNVMSNVTGTGGSGRTLRNNQSGSPGFFRNATSNNGLRIIIEYTDTTGQRVSVEKNVSINFRSSTSTGTGTNINGRSSSTSFIGSTMFWVIIIVVLGVIGFFVYKKFMPKKKTGK